MWPQSSPAAMGSFTLGAGGGVVRRTVDPDHTQIPTRSARLPPGLGELRPSPGPNPDPEPPAPGSVSPPEADESAAFTEAITILPGAPHPAGPGCRPPRPFLDRVSLSLR